MNTKSFFMVAIGAFVLASCNLNQVDQTGLLTASVRDALNSPATLSIADEIESVEYIPLEMTNDDASLIDGVVDFAITSKYIYVLVGKEARIVLFDRQGHFLRTFLRQGQGPDDFNGMIGFIQADEADNRFYVIGNKVGIYTLEGTFDVYEQYYDAFEAGDAALMESCGRQLETTIKKMAKDIHDKYVDPPFTTDFAILFLPFESIYAEVIRRTSLVETLQKDYKIVVTGPTTLGAILNSLQMGFRTLAIQKRTGEVWTVLGAVKTEFGKFGGLLEKVQKNLQSAGDQLEEVMGKRTRAIERKLRQVEELPHEESRRILPIDDGGEDD